MRKDVITTSMREIERLERLQKVMERQLTQVRGAEMIGVTNQYVFGIFGRVQ